MKWTQSCPRPWSWLEIRLKVRILFFTIIGFICFNESILKIMKNAIYFILKALSVLKISEFFSWLFGSYSTLVSIRLSNYDVTLICLWKKKFNLDISRSNLLTYLKFENKFGHPFVGKTLRILSLMM